MCIYLIIFRYFTVGLGAIRISMGGAQKHLRQFQNETTLCIGYWEQSNIDSGGLEEEVNNDMERHMKEMELDGVLQTTRSNS